MRKSSRHCLGLRLVGMSEVGLLALDLSKVSSSGVAEVKVVQGLECVVEAMATTVVYRCLQADLVAIWRRGMHPRSVHR